MIIIKYTATSSVRLAQVHKDLAAIPEIRYTRTATGAIIRTDSAFTAADIKRQIRQHDPRSSITARIPDLASPDSAFVRNSNN